jgi:hypothetical protein
MDEATAFAIALGTSLVVGSVLFVLGIRFGRDIERSKVRKVVIDIDGSMLADSGVEVATLNDPNLDSNLANLADALRARGYKRVNDPRKKSSL